MELVGLFQSTPPCSLEGMNEFDLSTFSAFKTTALKG